MEALEVLVEVSWVLKTCLEVGRVEVLVVVSHLEEAAPA